jgi:hypothetical protein
MYIRKKKDGRKEEKEAYLSYNAPVLTNNSFRLSTTYTVVFGIK